MHRPHHGKALVWILIAVVLVGGGAAWTVTRPAAASAAWLHDVDAGITRAESERRPMLVLFTADWCPPCQRMKRHALGNAEVMSALEETFVLVKVDLTDRGGPNDAVAIDHGVQSIPTVMVYDEHGTHVESAKGARTSTQLLALAHRFER